MTGPPVVACARTGRLIDEPRDQLGSDPRHVAERHDHLAGAAQGRGTAPQRRRLPLAPPVADDDLGAAEVDACTDLLSAIAEHDDDALERRHRALRRDGVLQQRAPVDDRELLRLGAESRPGARRQDESGNPWGRVHGQPK